jgi:two-component system sensor histidine kinase EvgS
MLVAWLLFTLALSPVLTLALGYVLHDARADDHVATVIAVVVAGLIAALAVVLRAFRRVAAAWRIADAAHRSHRTSFAIVAHEIRTPMHAVIGILDLLRQDASVRGEALHYVTTAHECVNSLLKLIGNSLDRVRIGEDRMPLHPVPNRIDALIEGIVEVFGPLAASRRLTLRTEFSPLPHREYLADALRVRQVLVNLLGNAIKFSENGTIVISLEALPDDGRDGQRLRIRIADCGAGIDAHDLPRVFEPFFQGRTGANGTPASTARGKQPDKQPGKPGNAQRGTGLGLSISRDLARAMGGDVDIASECGAGTLASFTLRLAPVTGDSPRPDAAPEPASEPAMPKSVMPPPLGLLPTGARVLAVDDHPANRMILERQLRHLGLEPHVVARGTDALHAIGFDPARFQWLITDCRMSGMTGAELAAAVRRREREMGANALPIIGYTADMRSDCREQALAAGMNACLRKPVSLGNLERALAALLPPALTGLLGAASPANHVFLRVPHEDFEDQGRDFPDGSLKDRSLDECFNDDGFNDSAVIETLLVCNAADLDTLECAVRERRWHSACAVAHRIAGAARLTAAHDVATACEDIVRAHRDDNHEQVATAVSSLRRTMEIWERSLRSRVVSIDPR